MGGSGKAQAKGRAQKTRRGAGGGGGGGGGRPGRKKKASGKAMVGITQKDQPVIPYLKKRVITGREKLWALAEAAASTSKRTAGVKSQKDWGQ